MPENDIPNTPARVIDTTEGAAEWIRVRNTITGHRQSVQVVLPEHEVLDQPAVNANGDPLPAKPHVPAKNTPTKKAAPAATKEKS